MDGLLRHARFRLMPGLVAAAQAREHVRAAIRAWRVPVDEEVAVLLASELVANAITHGQLVNGARTPPATAEPIMLSIRCYRGELRVEVHDRSSDMPAPAAQATPAEAETGRGLVLVAALAAKWGFYRTPRGKAVYFTLAPGPVPPAGLPRRGDGVP
jgi:anti-sigma regulatory factor (Ser/Thr protein kinase)